MVVLVLVIGEDAIDPLPDHAQERLRGESRVAAVVEGGRELFGEPEDLVELSDRQESGIAGEGIVGDLDLDGPRGQKIEGKERSRV